MMAIIYSIVILILSTALILKIIWIVQFNYQVKELFNGSAVSSEKSFDYHNLVALPAPVQLYFKHVLKAGQHPVSYTRIKHNGLFKTGLYKEWVPIKGEQYATTETPGFIWKGTTSMFTARDMYIAGQGRLVVCLLSILKIVDAKGGNYNQGELLRWLGESVLYPTNLLPSDRITWTAIDSATSKINFNYNGILLFYLVTFNTEGEIIQLETKRYMDSVRLETWIISVADYKQYNDMLVPTRFVVSWRLKEGDFAHAKFNITEIEYDLPKIFKHTL